MYLTCLDVVTELGHDNSFISLNGALYVFARG
jgi:hypothetical protein